MIIRDATEADLPALLEIHNDAIRNQAGIWLDDEESLEQRRDWFEARQRANFPVIVAEGESGQVIGYASYGTYRGRGGYRLTVEHSVYLLADARGKGTGKALMERLIEVARERGMHAMVAVIDAENTLSIRMHEKFGFQAGGLLKQVGIKFGTWRDQYHLVLLLDERETPPGR